MNSPVNRRLSLSPVNSSPTPKEQNTGIPSKEFFIQPEEIKTQLGNKAISEISAPYCYPDYTEKNPALNELKQKFGIKAIPNGETALTLLEKCNADVSYLLNQTKLNVDEITDVLKKQYAQTKMPPGLLATGVFKIKL